MSAAKADESAGIVLSAAAKFGKPIIVASEDARNVVDPAVQAYNANLKESVAGVLGDYGATRLTEHRGTLERLHKELGPLVGGMQGGASWTAGFDAAKDNITDHFKKTLDKTDARALEKLIVKVDKAREQCAKDRARWKEYVPADLMASVVSVTGQAEQVRLEAYVTKYETLCFRALINSNHKKGRLQEFVAAFASATHKDASVKFFGPAWHEIDIVLLGTT